MNSSKPANKWLKRLAIILIIIGIGFRFFNLGHKVYWYDEVQTSFRISGYTQEDFFQQVYIGWPDTVEHLVNIYIFMNMDTDVLYVTQHQEVKG